MIEENIQSDTQFSHKFVEEYMQAVPKLQVYIQAMTKDPTLAEDIVQDVFVKGWNWLQQHPVEDMTYPKAWIWRITKNTVLDYMRRQKLIAFIPISIFDTQEEYGHDHLNHADQQYFITQERGYEQIEASEVILTMFPLLQEKDQQFLFLLYVLDLPLAEVGRMLGFTSYAAAKMFAVRARARFYALYKRHYKE